MAVSELVQSSPIGFKLVEAAWCTVGAIFVSNWRMRYWNVPVFALLVTNTFGYALISILLLFINLTGKPRYFVCVVFTGLGSALNFLAANLMIIRIFVFGEPKVKGEEPYHYTSEGLLAFWMYPSYSYAQPELVFYPNWIRILIPSFVSGYIIVNLSEMIGIAAGHPHVFIEMVFAGIGCAMSLVCGISEMYQWTSWFSSVIGDTQTTGWHELLLAIWCLLNAATLLIDFIRYVCPRALQNVLEDSFD